MTSRFTLTDHAALEPGIDAVTGSSKGPFVDTGAWLLPSPRRRRLYLSVATIRELAEVAGVIEPPSATALTVAQARSEGALEVIKENLGGDLVRVLGRLAVVLADVRPGDGAEDGTADNS